MGHSVYTVMEENALKIQETTMHATSGTDYDKLFKQQGKQT